MTFQDIFKSSFLENTTSVGIFDMGLALILAFGIGMFIFLVYKKTYQGVMYSSSFGTTLIALTMITTLVILAVISNVVLSLGMVGALSIVRFRTAIKEPLDIAFLFWAIAAGIVLAAENQAKEFLKGQVRKCVVKSKTAKKGAVELNMEIRMKDDDTDFINILSDMPGINSAVLVSYNGEYMG